MIQTVLELIKEVVSFLRKLLSLRKAGDEIVRTSRIYDEMREVVQTQDNHVQRFLVIMAHNGGSDMKSYTPSFVSVVHEEIRAPIHSVKGNYQKLGIDADYIKMLRDLYINKEVVIDVTTMAPSLLRTIYMSEGVKYAKVFFLKHTKKSFWFCSIGTADAGQHLDDPKTSLAITLAVNNIKNVMYE